MDLLRKYFVPFFQAPDPAGANADPLPTAPDPASTLDLPPETPVPGEKTVPVSVMVREITPLRAKVRETEAELATSRRTIAEQNELLSRLQKPGEQPPPPARQPVVQPQPDDVDRRAAELVFRRDAQQVSETGLATYGQGWVDAVNALNAYGVNSDDFVSSVIEIDRAKAHEIMHTIAQDGEKAIALANMSPARRIAEITRMAMAPAAQKTEPVTPAAPVVPPKTVSRAPAPPPPVDPSASKVVDWRADESSDVEFDKGFEEMMKRRSARR
jgi:hypothetical protein